MAKTVDNGTLTDYDVATAAGAVDADTQRVTLASDDPAVVALQLLDNAISGNEMQVDVLTMPTVTVQDGGGSITVDGTVTATVGTVTAVTTVGTITNVVHVDDNAGTLTVDDGGGSLTVDGTFWQATQPVSGTVTANAGTGTFTVAGAVTNTVLSVVGGGLEATAQRVTLASDSTGVLSVDDNGGSLTVDGTVAATQSGTWNVTNVSGTVSLPTGASTAANQTTIIGHVDGIETLLGTIDTDTGALAATVSGTEVQVDVVAALPAGTNAIGKLAANSGVDIGDVDVTSLVPGTAATSLGKAVDSAAGATDTGVALLAVRDDALTTLTPIDGDYTPLRVSSTGALHVTGGGGGTQYAEDAAHASGDTGTMALAVRKDTATALAGTDGDYTPLITNASGALHVAVASGSVTATGSISLTTATSGGYTPMDLIDIDETEDEVKASGGTVGGWVFTNLAASTRYVRFYNAAAASVTVGTTAAEIVIAIPAGAGVVMPVGSPGIAFSTGICVAATTGVAANDTGAPGANEVVGTVFYA